MPHAQQPTPEHFNHLHQPVGPPVEGWTERPRPPRTPMEGRLCRIEPLDADRHAKALHEEHISDKEGRNWTYLPYGPFVSAEEYASWLRARQAEDDPLFFTIMLVPSQRPVGVAAYLRIDPEMGSIEVGHLSYSPALQRTAAATEAMYLMMRRAFEDLGYRRYEWKCNSFNKPSWYAAERLGFRYEGTFRQNWVHKGRNRDNAWFSIIDSEWPAIRAALEDWLDVANFDAAGRQRRRLGDFMIETGAAPG
jgi:RimJ/RimL family protein N-acetyltransferase